MVNPLSKMHSVLEEQKYKEEYGSDWMDRRFMTDMRVQNAVTDVQLSLELITCMLNVVHLLLVASLFLDFWETSTWLPPCLQWMVFLFPDTQYLFTLPFLITCVREHQRSFNIPFPAPKDTDSSVWFMSALCSITLFLSVYIKPNFIFQEWSHCGWSWWLMFHDTFLNFLCQNFPEKICMES